MYEHVVTSMHICTYMYRADKKNITADTLSRNPPPTEGDVHFDV